MNFASSLRALKNRFLAEPLPAALQVQIKADRAGVPTTDAGISSVTDAALAWLCRAQDQSASADGGVARDFSLRTGWSTSYPETTGYIVPTFLTMATVLGRNDLRLRAEKMLQWLCKIQLPSGAIQGGKVNSTPIVPVPFNTGQVLLGLAAGEREFAAFREPLRKAADWLVAVQDSDGAWRKHYSPFATPGEKTYDTHIAWGLLEAERVDPGRGYGAAALANIGWCLGQQRANGWFERCCLSNFDQPLTHTIGYTLRGIIEAHRFSGDVSLLVAARRTADALITVLGADGFLPGKLTADWTPAAKWACLTGTVQIAHCWLMLSQVTGERRYRDAGALANKYVRRTVALDGDVDRRGAVRGSFPIDGDYGQYSYPNWAAKFMIDSLLLEQQLA